MHNIKHIVDGKTRRKYISKYAVRESNRDGIRFLQLYINKNREITKTLIKLAEQYDFKALVITVDAQVLGKRINDIKRQFSSPPGTRFEILL